MALPLVLGYLDVFTDVYAVVSYYQVHIWWFALGLAFLVGPGIVAAIFFLRLETMRTRMYAALHLGLLMEAFNSIENEAYSHVLVTLRVVEPLYESVPQLILQVYALLVEWDDSQWLPGRLLSIALSCFSLAYATTSIVAEQPLSQLPPNTNDSLTSCCPCFTGRAFATVPESGNVPVYGHRLHPQNFVWLFFVYQVLEIVSRFISLALLALVLRAYFFLVLVWLWGSRFVIIRWSLGSQQNEPLYLRSQLRLVGMPFMDSVMDSVDSYGVGVVLTAAEFLICVLIGNLVSTNEPGQMPDNARQTLTYAAVVCMAGKLVFGCLVIRPFKRNVPFGYGGSDEARSLEIVEQGNVDVTGARVDDGSAVNQERAGQQVLGEEREDNVDGIGARIDDKHVVYLERVGTSGATRAERQCIAPDSEASKKVTWQTIRGKMDIRFERDACR